MIAAYFLLQVGVRLLTTNVAVLDESEQVMLSQYFSLGYNAQPPLYTWLQIGFFKLFGISVIGLSLLKNVLLFTTYFFVYKIGILLTQDKVKSVLCALSLMLLPQIIWESQVDQAHTVLLTTASALTFYFYFKIVLQKPRLINFILLGLSASIGLLAKYNFALVLVGLGGTALVLSSFREKFFQKQLWISVAIVLLVTFPHFVWFMMHFELATSSTVERMNVLQTGDKWQDVLRGMKDLTFSFLTFISPFWLIFLGFFKKNLRWDESSGTKALLWFIGIVFICLFLMVLVTGVTNIKERWLQPFLILFPLLLFLQTDVDCNYKRIKIYVLVCLGIAFFVDVMIVTLPRTIDLKGKPSRTNFPFASMEKDLRSLLGEDQDVLIHAEDKFVGGNIRLLFPKLTVITPSLPLHPYEMKNKLLFVYDKNPPELADKLTEKGYVCQKGKLEEYYQHSHNINYTLKYAYCSLSSGGKDSPLNLERL